MPETSGSHMRTLRLTHVHNHVCHTHKYTYKTSKKQLYSSSPCLSEAWYASLHDLWYWGTTVLAVTKPILNLPLFFYFTITCSSPDGLLEVPVKPCIGIRYLQQNTLLQSP